MKRNYRKLLRAGRKAQLEKLKQNPHKRGFEEITLEYGYRRLLEEAQELDAELHGSVRLSWEDIRNESADIMNFANMIIYKCDKMLT